MKRITLLAIMLLSLSCAFAQNKDIEALAKIKGVNYQFIDKDMVMKSILSGKPLYVFKDVSVNLNLGRDSVDEKGNKNLNDTYNSVQILLTKDDNAAEMLRKCFSKFVKKHPFVYNYNGSRNGYKAKFCYGNKKTGIQRMVLSTNNDGETGLVVINGN